MFFDFVIKLKLYIVDYLKNDDLMITFYIYTKKNAKAKKDA